MALKEHTKVRLVKDMVADCDLSCPKGSTGYIVHTNTTGALVEVPCARCQFTFIECPWETIKEVPK